MKALKRRRFSHQGSTLCGCGWGYRDLGGLGLLFWCCGTVKHHAAFLDMLSFGIQKLQSIIH